MADTRRYSVEQLVDLLDAMDILPGLPPRKGDVFEQQTRARILREVGGLDEFKRRLVFRVRNKGFSYISDSEVST